MLLLFYMLYLNTARHTQTGAIPTPNVQQFFTSNDQAYQETIPNSPIRPMIHFHNFVKRSLYEKVFNGYPRGSTIVEMAAGRGGGLWMVCIMLFMHRVFPPVHACAGCYATRACVM